jgi:hypothetical protein
MQKDAEHHTHASGEKGHSINWNQHDEWNKKLDKKSETNEKTHQEKHNKESKDKTDSKVQD